MTNGRRQKAEILAMNDIGKAYLTLNDNIFFDTYKQNKNTGSFILIDDKNFNTVAAGLITKELNDKNFAGIGKEGLVLWFTGLSSSGKSTLAKKIYNKFKAENLSVEWLDGNAFREKFNFDLGFSRQDRIKNIERAAYMAKLLVKNGINVIGSFITPYEEQRKILRKSFKNYVEIFVDTPFAVCQARDVKGIYKKVENGEVKNFTGQSDPYEKPKKFAIHLKTDEVSLDDCAASIFTYLEKYGLIKW